MRRRCAGLLLAVAAAALTLGQTPATAAEKSPVMLVVDVSGSMAEDDGAGVVKLAGAKNAISAFISDLPDGTPTGLRTYPSGSGDCGAGKLAWKPEALNRSRLGAEVRSLEADGGTPTAQALLATQEDLERAGYKRGTVVLVSDGESNCEKDGPVCDVARRLADQGMALTVNTVGFNISEAGRQELECVAEATGGVYSDVQGAGELADRLNDIARGRLDLSVSAPATVRMTAGAADPAGRRVVATVTNPGVAAAQKVQVTLQMLAPKAEDGSQRFVSTSQPVRLLGNLPPGARQTVEWQFRPPITFSANTLSYRVLAGPVGGTATEATGTVKVTSEISLADAGPLLQGKKRVAILGDSYSSGEGGGDYEAGTDTRTNTCHRSGRTYAMSLFPTPPTVLACSGAIAAQVELPNKDLTGLDGKGVLPSQAVQLQRLRDAGRVPDLVLMTMGGNDVGFGDIIKKCVRGPNCVKRPFTVKPGAYDKLRGLPSSLTDAYTRVNAVLNSEEARKQRSGRVAPIVVLAYPQLFPNEVEKKARCQGYLEADEIRFANQLGRDLNVAIGLLVEQLRRQSPSIPIYFAADVEQALLPDHTMCSAQPWVHEVDLGKNIVAGLDPTNRIGGSSTRESAHAYHPTPDGFRAMTAALVRYSTSKDANTEVPPAPLAGARPGPLQGEPILLQPGATPDLDLRPGEQRPLEVRELTPSTEVEVLLRSAPVVLARSVTDADGVLRVDVRVPTTVPPGRHELQVVEVESLEVLLAASADVAPLRPWWWMPGGVTSGVLLLSGVGLLGHRRRLRRAAAETDAAAG